MGDNNQDKYLGFTKSTYYYKKRKSQNHRPKLRQKRNTGFSSWLRDNSFLIKESCEVASSSAENNSTVHISTAADKFPLTIDGETLPIPDSEAPTFENTIQQQTCLLLDDDNNISEKGAETSLIDEVYHPSEPIMKICSIRKKHNFSDAAMTDILRLLHSPIILENRKQVPRTVEKFDAGCGVSTIKVNFGWQCKKCHKDKVQQVVQGSRKPDLRCCEVYMSYNENHFLYYNCEDILKVVLPTVSNDFRHQTDFQEVRVTLNTDGAPMFKGSNSSIWPVLGTIDGILYSSKKFNVLLFGIWVGPRKGGKPNFDTFLEPIIRQLKILSDIGLQWINSDGKQIKSKVIVSKVLCDSIARPQVQNMSQFNAEFGCPYCLHQETGHYFTHQSIKDLRLRTMDNYGNDLTFQSQSSAKFHGIKGTSSLSILPYFDVILGFPPDALHAVYLGVVKQLLEQLLISSNFREKFYLQPSKQQAINEMLLTIKPPNRVSRPPRSLTNFKFYKGHEFLMLLLYYSPILLEKKLDALYYKNWMRLSRSISLLSSENVTECDIVEAETLLETFSSEIAKLYGSKHQRFNIHLLLHIGTFVRTYGPLQDFSMTYFENFNMQLQKYVKSSFGVGNQVCKRYYADIIHNHHTRSAKVREYEPGPKITRELSGSEIQYFSTMNICKDELTFHTLIRKGSLLLQCKNATKSKLRDNSWFLINDQIAYQADIFAYHSKTRSFYAIGTHYTIELNRRINLPHCFEITNQRSDIVKIPSDAKILMHIECDGNVYIFKFLNNADAMNE